VMQPRFRIALLIILVVLAVVPRVQAQAAAQWLPTWDPGLLSQDGTSILRFQVRQDARSHTRTGLLVGGLIGAAATTVFLIGFCGDPDTKCEMDEVGRAVLFIAVPAAALGALIGSLIHTKDEENEANPRPE
jgi:hypothetical protein